MHRILIEYLFAHGGELKFDIGEAPGTMDMRLTWEKDGRKQVETRTIEPPDTPGSDIFDALHLELEQVAQMLVPQVVPRPELDLSRELSTVSKDVFDQFVLRGELECHAVTAGDTPFFEFYDEYMVRRGVVIDNWGPSGEEREYQVDIEWMDEQVLPRE